MSDFEVHAIGTFEEIKASRELARAIEQITIQFGNGIVPHSVFQAYQKLLAVYNLQIANGTP
jgi:hypothetical protein